MVTKLDPAAAQAATGVFAANVVANPTTGELFAALRFALEAYESVRVAPVPAGQHDAGESAWISVDERLPEHAKDDAALVWASWEGAGSFRMMRRQGEARYIKSMGWQPYGCTGWDWNVTHWMPLPPPPDLTSRAQRTTEGELK